MNTNPNRRRRGSAPLVTYSTCTSHAAYWVTTNGGAQRPVCGPHLHRLLGQLYVEHPVIAPEEPAPGTPCSYTEVA